MSYVLLRQVHVACVVATLGFFLLRGAWMIRVAEGPKSNRRPCRSHPIQGDPA
jgi:uncharacterized membrane protein SirB2